MTAPLTMAQAALGKRLAKTADRGRSVRQAAAAIYTRVSKDKSGRQRSPQEQEKGGRRDAEMYDLPVVAVYCDTVGASEHSHAPRPDYVRLQHDLAAGLWHVLVIYGVDRASRQTQEFGELIDLCRAYGVMMIVNGRPFDMNEPRDVAQLKREAVDAELEVAITRMRSMRALNENAEAGLPHGRKTWGYVRTYNGAGKVTGQVIDAEVAPIIREAFLRCAKRESLHSIIKDFDARGLYGPTGKPWNGNTSRLRQVLMRKTYAAIRQHHDTDHEAAWEPIVDRALWDRVQAILENNAQHRNPNTTGSSAPKHLLTHLMECGVCGGIMSFQMKYQQKPIYRCKVGGHVGRRADLLDEFVSALVVERMVQPDALAAFHADNAARLAEVTRSLRDLEGSLARAEAAWLNDVIDEDAYGKKQKALKPKIAALRAEHDALNASVPVKVKEFAGPDAAARWAKASINDKRALIREVVKLRVMAVGLVGRPPAGSAGPIGIEWQWVGDKRWHKA